MRDAAVIIPAAGRGVRMGTKTPKAFLSLEGAPMLARTIDVFQRCRRVRVIQPVLPRKDLVRFRLGMLARFGWSKCLPPVAGGRERQDSITRGRDALPGDIEFVMVHDAARPLVPPALVRAVLRAAERDGAAIAAVPVQDTVKKSSTGSYIERTVERRGLWLAQTPQAFRAGLLREAYLRARGTGHRGTDDASLVEAAGHPVALVTGSALNLKVTTPEDLALVRGILRRRGR